MPLISNLDIVNAAFARIGEDPVQSLTAEDPGGQSAGLIFEELVEFNLGIYQFQWAKQHRQLSTDDLATPLTGYALVYDLPAERIGNPLYLTDDPTDPDRRFDAWQQVGVQIHTDATALVAMIRFRPDANIWSAPFRSATITALAARLAVPQTHDRALAEDLHREAYGTPQEMFRGGQFGAAIRDDANTAPARRQERRGGPLLAAWQGGQ